MKNGPYELIVPPADYPGMRYRGKYAYEHIVVFWQTHGRMPRDGYLVHHKNDQKRDNQPSNLEEKTVADHNEHHNSIDPAALVCWWCRSVYELRPSKARTKLKLSISGGTFCKRKCQVRYQFLHYGHPRSGAKMLLAP